MPERELLNSRFCLDFTGFPLTALYCSRIYSKVPRCMQWSRVPCLWLGTVPQCFSLFLTLAGLRSAAQVSCPTAPRLSLSGVFSDLDGVVGGVPSQLGPPGLPDIYVMSLAASALRQGLPGWPLSRASLISCFFVPTLLSARGPSCEEADHQFLESFCAVLCVHW